MPSLSIRDVSINYEISGNDCDEAVLLVHGFPDSLKLWRFLAPKLVEAGYKVIALDLPGYGDSSIPDKSVMRVDHIADIIQEFLDQLGVSRVHLIGHDWGSAVSWYFASTHGEYVRSYTALSVGHPKSYLSAGPDQAIKAWYVMLILNTGLAEKLFTADDWSLFKNFLQTRNGLDENWVPDMQREGRLTAAFNIYRANLMPGDQNSPLSTTGNIGCDVLAIFGEDDLALTPKQMQDSAQYVEGSFTLKEVPKAEHWLPLHNHEDIAPWIIDFLNKESEKN